MRLLRRFISIPAHVRAEFDANVQAVVKRWDDAFDGALDVFPED